MDKLNLDYTTKKAQHQKNIQGLKTILGILADKDPELSNIVSSKLATTEANLRELETVIKNTGSEHSFVQDAIKRRDKK